MAAARMTDLTVYDRFSGRRAPINFVLDFMQQNSTAAAPRLTISLKIKLFAGKCGPLYRAQLELPFYRVKYINTALLPSFACAASVIILCYSARF
jgi:hypothetical protein